MFLRFFDEIMVPTFFTHEHICWRKAASGLSMFARMKRRTYSKSKVEYNRLVFAPSTMTWSAFIRS